MSEDRWPGHIKSVACQPDRSKTHDSKSRVRYRSAYSSLVVAPTRRGLWAPQCLLLVYPGFKEQQHRSLDVQTNLGHLGAYAIVACFRIAW